jgi:hypothetical protein
VIDPLFPFFTNISPREQFNARFFPGFQGPNQKQLANQPSLNGATTPAATTSNLSGNADQFTAIDRERCPTPAEREIMDSFKPRELTEAVMSRFYKKHNPKKLENPTFIAGIMKHEALRRRDPERVQEALPRHARQPREQRRQAFLSSPPPQGLLLINPL